MSPSSSSACDPGANALIERLFGDCVFDSRDMLGFVAGMLSIACWMVAQVREGNEREKGRRRVDGRTNVGGGPNSKLTPSTSTSTTNL